ncbi:MAG: hypothetical protein WA628_16550 [Terriglobales bacterium]
MKSGNLFATKAAWGGAMESENGQKIRQLCEQAANEQDTTRLMELVKQIVETFDDQRSHNKKPPNARTTKRM